MPDNEQVKVRILKKFKAFSEGTVQTFDKDLAEDLINDGLVEIYKPVSNEELILEVNKSYAENTKTTEEQFQEAEDSVRKKFNQEMITLILLNKKDDATTEIAKEFIRRNHVYSIRSDVKPEIWVYKEGIYVPEGITFITEFCNDILKEALTSYFINRVVLKVQAVTFIEHQKFFENDYVDEICCENGILQVRTGELIEFDPDKKFFNKIPVIFDKDAKCTNWLKHLNEVLPDKSDIDLIQEQFGYCLYKKNKFEKGFMWYGSGSNGKTKTLETLKLLLGPNNCSNVPLQELETENFSRANLHTKLVNFCGDLSKTSLKKTGKTKQLISTDTISADRKNKTMIHFENFAKMFFAANELPLVYDDTPGFWRRWSLTSFPYYFVEEAHFEQKKKEALDPSIIKVQDKEIVAKFQNEMPGILNWALRGLQRLLKNNGFSNSKTEDETRRIWIRRTSSIAAFCLDCVKEDFGNELPKKEFAQAFNNYCRAHRLKGVSSVVIKNYLTIAFGAGEGRDRTMGKDFEYWEGIRLENLPNVGDENNKNGGARGSGGGFSAYREISKFVGAEKKSPVSPGVPESRQDTEIKVEETKLNDNNSAQDISIRKSPVAPSVPLQSIKDTWITMLSQSEDPINVDELFKAFPTLREVDIMDHVIVVGLKEGEWFETKPSFYKLL